MAKRFTDTEKWKKGCMKALSPKHKLLWFYMLDECDHAGIWHKELDVAELRIGVNIDEAEVREIFDDKIVVFDGGDKWFIPEFIEFQYGTLNENNNAHKSAIKKLKKYDLINSSLTPVNASENGAVCTPEKEEPKREYAGEKYSINFTERWDGNQPVDYQSFIDYFNKVTGGACRVTGSKYPDIKKQLKTFTGTEIKQALCNRSRALADSEYLTSWEAIFTRKVERMEKYLNLKTENLDHGKSNGISKTKGDRRYENIQGYFAN